MVNKFVYLIFNMYYIPVSFYLIFLIYRKILDIEVQNLREIGEFKAYVSLGSDFIILLYFAPPIASQKCVIFYKIGSTNEGEVQGNRDYELVVWSGVGLKLN